MARWCTFISCCRSGPWLQGACVGSTGSDLIDMICLGGGMEGRFLHLGLFGAHIEGFGGGGFCGYRGVSGARYLQE